MKSGMKFLIESFYRSIVEDAPVPIPYEEILRTATIMDTIFDQLAAKASYNHFPRNVPFESRKMASGTEFPESSRSRTHVLR